MIYNNTNNNSLENICLFIRKIFSILNLPAHTQSAIEYYTSIRAGISSGIIRIILFSLLMFFVFNPALSQPNYIKFKHINVETGLSQNSVWTILQDQKGFMWFGTDFGLNEFNGYSFRTIKNDDNRLNISSDKIDFLFEDAFGLLWIGTKTGVNVFDRPGNSIKKYTYEQGDTTGLLSKSIYSIFEDRYKNVWIATENGLNMYDRKKDRFYRLIPPSLANRSISRTITTACSDRRGNILIGYSDMCMDKLFIPKDLSNDFYNNINGIKLLSIQLPIKVKDNSIFKIKKIIQDKNDEVWAGSNGFGLFRIPDIEIYRETYSLSSKRIISKINYIRYFNKDFDNKNISNNYINDIHEDKSGYLWIATEGGGINLFNRKDNSFTYFKNDPANPNSISNNHIVSIYEDISGNLLFGTHSGGVNIYDGGKNTMRLYRSNPSIPGALKSDMVSCIYEDKKGTLWIGSKFGLNEFDRNKNTAHLYLNDPDDQSSISNNLIVSIYGDRQDRIWVGTKEGGLNLFDRKKRNFIRYNKIFAEKGLLGGTTIRSLYCDKNNILWIGSNSGLIRYNVSSGAMKTYIMDPNDPNSISTNYVWAIFEDKDENLWVGTNKGLNLFFKEEEKFLKFYQNPDLGNNEANNIILCISQDNQGVIWAGTLNGGMYKIIPQKKHNAANIEIFDFTQPGLKMIRHFFGNNLDKAFIYGLINDDTGNLWISTHLGLWKFNPHKNIIRSYDITDGLQDNEFNSGSYFKSSSGELFFGGANGFNSFYPNDIKENFHIPNIVLTNFKIFDRPVEFEKDISNIEEIKLKHDDNFIRFEFAALDFTEPKKNQYSYILEGFDQNWTKAETRRSANYTNLPGGEYTFRVRASNSSGLWNEDGMAVKIIVTPPIWNNTWFKIVSIFIVIGLILFIFNLRFRTMERQRIKLESLVEERTKKLKESNDTKDLLFSIIGHDLRSPIGFIKSTTELISENKDSLTNEDYYDFFAGIKSSANNTFNLLENLLYWAESQKGTLIFKPESVGLNSLIRSSLELLKDNADQKNISFHFSPEKDLYVSIDRNMIMTVFRNILSNALKFTNEGGNISVVTGESDNHIDISIMDSGIGMSPETRNKLFQLNTKFTTKGTKGEKGTGLGLLLCKEFIETNGGKIRVESKLGEGTKFIFTLPKSQELT